MRPLDQMNHLVDDDVLETRSRLFREIGVEADAAVVRVAVPPLGLHPLHEESLHSHVQQRLPSRQQWRHGLLQLFSIPFLDKSLPHVLAGSRSHPQNDAAVLYHP